MRILRRLVLATILTLSLLGLLQAEETVSISVEEGGTESISNDANLAEPLELDEVEIGAGASLVLPPFKSIIIHKLIAHDGARIRLAHASSGSNGGAGANGGDAANSRFFLGRVEGHLLIEARGGDGGDGLSGIDGAQGLDGKPGRAGRSLFWGAIYVGDGDNGKPGEPGQNGTDGGDGGDGGRGGKVWVFFREKAEFASIVVDASGGDGGKPGRAGLGGLGGNGGAGGKGVKHGKPGKMGVAGRPGVPGKSGRAGIAGAASVYQLPRKLYTCLVRLEAIAASIPLRDSDLDQCRGQEEVSNLPSNLTVVGASSSSLGLEELRENFFSLNAQGSAGKNAADSHSPQLKAPAGGNGANGGDLTVLIQEVPERVLISAKGGDGGRGGNGALGIKGADGKDGRDEKPFKKATAGQDGQNGGDGGPGSDGGQGGSGGKVRVVKIGATSPSHDWTAHFDFDVAGGRGGSPGEGGPGARGGQGGRGGKISWSNQRKQNGKNGTHGRPGISGNRGPNGEDGSYQFLEAPTFTDWILEEFRSSLAR